MNTFLYSKFLKFVFILPFYFFFLLSDAQTLIPDFYCDSGSANADNNSKFTLDDDENLYTIGRYSGNTYFNSTLVITYGSSNFILSKFDKHGNFIWGKTVVYGVGGSLRDIIWHNGTLYICGNFSSELILKNQNSDLNDTIKTKGNNDFFIAQYDSQGSLKSYKSFGSEYNEFVYNLGILNNKIIISGKFDNYIEFDSENPTEINTIFSSNNYDVFIACIDKDYKFVWAKRAGGNFNDALNSMSVYRDCIFLTGYFINNMNFNTPSSVNSNLLSAYGSGDIFVAKYDQYGNPIWFKRAGSSYDPFNESYSYEYGTDLFVNKHGVYVVGIAERDAHFNGPQDTNFIIFEDYDFDEGFRGYFVAHYDLNGNIKFVKDQQTTYSLYTTLIAGSDQYYSICGNLNQDIEEYSVYYQDTFSFKATLSYDIITRLYDYQGNFITGAKCGGIKSDYINDIQLNKNNIYLTGTFNETLNFYDGETSVSHIVTTGSNDIFMARYPFPEFIQDTIEFPIFSLKLFPNPADKQITITNTSDQIGLNYFLYDIMGRIVIQGKLSQNENIVNISDLKAGIYFVKIMTTKPKTIKFVKY